jgi:transcriptional regulator with XRE-family HTH domain
MANDTETDLAGLGPTLALLRRRRHLTRAEVARRAGIGKSQLSKYEAGKELPKLATLARISRVLGVDLAELWYTVRLMEELPPGADQLTSLIPRDFIPELEGGFSEVMAALLRLHRGAVRWVLARQGEAE